MTVKGKSKKNLTSLTGMCDPYLKPGFWNERQYWETDSYTQEGKEYLREFLKKTNKNDRRIKGGKPLNSKHL